MSGQQSEPKQFAKRELPELTNAAKQFLKVLKMFEGKKINLASYALMLNKSRRWLRMLLRELREKGYVAVLPLNMCIHKSDACRYIFLDGEPMETHEVPTYRISKEIADRLGLLDSDP